MWLQQSKTNYLMTNRKWIIIQGYISGTVLLSNIGVLLSVLSVSAIYSVLSALSEMETSIKLVCNILTLTEKHMKPQI